MKWFKVGVCSPDDLDLDLEFDHANSWLRQDVISYLMETNKIGVTYRGVLSMIQDFFKAGTLE